MRHSPSRYRLAPTTRATSLEQTLLQRVAGQLRIRRKLELREHARAIDADGLRRQRERVADLLQRPACGDELQRLEFAIGQQLVRRRVRVVVEALDELFGELRRDVAAPP